MQSEMLQQLYAQIISDHVHSCIVGCRRRSTQPAHFLDVLTVGGASTATDVAAVGLVVAWLTLHSNHFLIPSLLKVKLSLTIAFTIRR